MNSSKPPRFWGSYITALRQSAARRGWRAIFPSWVIVSFVCGGIVAYYIPNHFWGPSKEVGTAVYVGALTLNGLILVLSWNAFLRMQEIISDSNFGAYLYDRELLNGYLFYMKYVNVAQMTALVTSAISLLIFLCDIDQFYERSSFMLVVGTSGYAIKSASAAVSAMHDLIWQKAVFDSYQIASRVDSGGHADSAGYVVTRKEHRAAS